MFFHVFIVMNLIILVLNINSYGVYNPLSYSVIVFVKSNLFFTSSKWINAFVISFTFFNIKFKDIMKSQ